MLAPTATASLEEKSKPKFLVTLCIYLVIVVCIQFAIIFNIHAKLHGTRIELEIIELRTRTKVCESEITNHVRLVKRQSGQGWWEWNGPGQSEGQFCPQGCVRRRRRKGSGVGVTARPEVSTRNYDGYGQSGYPGRGQPGMKGAQGTPGQPGQSGSPGQPGQSGYPGQPGQSGYPGQPGQSGSPGQPGQSGSPGQPGQSGYPGQPGQSGSPGQPGQSGYSGQPGQSGYPGQPGQSGSPGQPGQSGYSGQPGHSGYPGHAGSPGARGSPGESGYSGSRGSSGLQGPPGQRGSPGQSQSGYSYGQHNYYDLRSGTSRGDQRPEQLPALRNQTSAGELLREFQLHAHPECKDDVNHQAMMDRLKNTGKVSFMILIDLQDNKYCILHA